jgi:hypothetical protein
MRMRGAVVKWICKNSQFVFVTPIVALSSIRSENTSQSKDKVVVSTTFLLLYKHKSCQIRVCLGKKVHNRKKGSR